MLTPVHSEITLICEELMQKERNQGGHLDEHPAVRTKFPMCAIMKGVDCSTMRPKAVIHESVLHIQLESIV